MTASKGSGMRVVVFDERDKILPLMRKAMFESVASFNHLPTCMSFVEENTLHNEAAVIVTSSIEEHVLETFEASEPIKTVFILSTRRRDVDKLPSKVVGIYPEIDDLLLALFETLDIIESELNANSFVFHRKENGSDNINFYFYNLWLSYERHQKLTKKDLVEQASIYFHSQKQILFGIHHFDNTYNPWKVLPWLNRHNHPFPYHLLVSNALRTHDQQILALVRFFILDLTKQMKPLSITHICNQTYYGTKLPIATVDRLEHHTGNDIIAFQCFLPVTKSRPNALAVATRRTRRRQVASVLFKIDPSNAFGVHMGDIILIDMSTPFHITSVSRFGDLGSTRQLVTIVQLVAVDRDYKHQLHRQFILRQKKQGKTIEDFILQTIPLFKLDNGYKKQNTVQLDVSKLSIPLYVVSSSSESRRSEAVCEDEAAADEFMFRGKWTQAVDAFSRIDDPNVRVLNKLGCLLREHLQNLPGALECHQQALQKAINREKAETSMYLGIVYNDMKQPDEALKYYSQALEWYENVQPKDPAIIARCLVGLGNAHWACGDLDQALDCAERALVLREQEVKPRNDFDIAGCLGNMGNILHDQGNMERALECSKRAVELFSKCEKDDPRLAAALNNLGAMYQVCGDYSEARKCFERALGSLSDENHPYRTSVLNNIARLNAVEEEQKR